MPKNSAQNPIQEQIRLLQQCPVCAKQYDPKQAKILEERGDAHLVHITCPHCLNSFLAVIVASQLGMSSVGMVTDLNDTDVKRLRAYQPISENELLDFHQYLKNNFYNFK